MQPCSPGLASCPQFWHPVHCVSSRSSCFGHRCSRPGAQAGGLVSLTTKGRAPCGRLPGPSTAGPQAPCWRRPCPGQREGCSRCKLQSLASCRTCTSAASRSSTWSSSASPYKAGGAQGGALRHALRCAQLPRGVAFGERRRLGKGRYVKADRAACCPPAAGGARRPVRRQTPRPERHRGHSLYSRARQRTHVPTGRASFCRRQRVDRSFAGSVCRQAATSVHGGARLR